MKENYKNLQGIIKFWCLTKWENCDIICAEKNSTDFADVIARVEDERIGFIFTLDKTTELLKQQIISCRKTCNRVYLITNSINKADLPELENNISLLNISNKYGLGNLIEEL